MLKKLLLMSCLCLPVPAQADDTNQASVAVHYGDLNLRTLAGQRLLEARVAAAVNKVCDSGDDVNFLRQLERHRCLKEVGKSVGPQVANALARAKDEPNLASK